MQAPLLYDLLFITTAATLHAVREACAPLRREANQLIGDVLRELRYRLHTRPAAVRRQIVRNYGTYFRPLPGEALDIAGGNDG